VAPASASVFKAFNTIFRGVLENGRPDVFVAGDDAQAKADVAAFIESLGLRPLDVGGLKMAHWLEGAGVLTVGLAGKVIVDISNPFNATFDGLAHSEETSIAQEVAKVAPAGASVVKAFNTIFRNVLEKGRPDVFIARDNAQAKASLKAFIESIGLRPLDVGGLKMAHWLEGVGVVTVGLAGNGVGHWDFALGVNEFTG